MYGGVSRNKNALVVACLLVGVASLVVFALMGGGAAVNTLGGLISGRDGSTADARRTRTQETMPAGAPEIRLVGSRVSSVDANIAISGAGFNAGEKVDVLVAGQEEANRDIQHTVQTVDAREDGSVGDVVLPAGQQLSPGSYAVSLRGADSGRDVAGSFWVGKFLPYVLPSAYTGKPSEEIFITAGYFAPGETVQLSLDGPPSAEAPTYKANEAGDLETIQWTIPYVPEGKHVIYLTGEQSLVPMDIQFDVQGYHPWVSLSSYASQVDELVDFSGRGFAPWEQINVYLNDRDSSPIVVLNADNEGAFTRNRAFEATKNLQGDNTLVFVGQVSRVEATAEYKMLPSTPSLWLTSHAAPPGGWVGFIGRGFLPHETVHVYLGSDDTAEEVLTLLAQDDGSLQNAGDFTVPFGQSGVLTLTAVGEKSKVPVSTNLEIMTLRPWMRVDPGGGPVGTQVRAEGHDFLGGEEVALYLGADQSSPLATATADNQGGASVGPVAIPDGSKGRVLLTLVGQKSGAKATGSFDVVATGQ
ncbi:MAG: hypothetical protein EPO21_13935 [Chloroflexota bacterium]|nr:MAG: hypothetical protein EPO21_13935 [Chloroflexota bacterium]